MSVDKLQNRIRKLKNPSMVAFLPDEALIPPAYRETAPNHADAFCRYAKDLLCGLKDIVPAVRFDFGAFAVQGAEGLEVLKTLVKSAREQKFYVLLDVPAAYSLATAALHARILTEQWEFDGLLLNCYLGGDTVKPFVDMLKDKEADLFLALRTANKSASEIQDLLTGTRLVYTAAADMAKRLGADLEGRCGYSRIGGVGPAVSGDSLQLLRSKYPALFLLIDGYDYSGANAKNCAVAFDKLGHGAIACAGDSILAAWQEEPGDPVALAVEAAERMKKNLTRYVAIL